MALSIPSIYQSRQHRGDSMRARARKKRIENDICAPPARRAGNSPESLGVNRHHALASSRCARAPIAPAVFFVDVALEI